MHYALVVSANTGSTNISLNNNEGPCQVGNNNSMVYGTTGPRYHSNINPRSHPGWTGPTSSPAPTQSKYL